MCLPRTFHHPVSLFLPKARSLETGEPGWVYCQWIGLAPALTFSGDAPPHQAPPVPQIFTVLHKLILWSCFLEGGGEGGDDLNCFLVPSPSSSKWTPDYIWHGMSRKSLWSNSDNAGAHMERKPGTVCRRGMENVSEKSKIGRGRGRSPPILTVEALCVGKDDRHLCPEREDMDNHLQLWRGGRVRGAFLLF